MSTKIDPKENVLFLVSCIGHSTNGKPNFEAVAQELNIVSKGAAAKRYERLLKAHGVAKPAGTATAAAAADGEDESAKPSLKKRKAPAAPKSPAAKKPKAAPRRKKAAAKKEEEDEDEEDVKAESDSSLSEPPEDLKEGEDEGDI